MSNAPTANTFSAARAMFRILGWAEASEMVTVRRVIDGLGVCDRQARDYLNFLVEVGWLRKTRRGRADEYRLRRGEGGAGVFAQAAGATLAIAALGALEGTAFHEAAAELVRTLDRELSEVHAPRLEHLRSAFYVVRSSVPMNPAHASHAEEILEAIRLEHWLHASYELLLDGSVRTYELRPISLVLHRDGLYLLAQKADGTIRTFDVEGFQDVRRLKRRAKKAPLAIHEYFEHAFGRYTDLPPEVVELRVTGITARQLRRRRFHRSQVVMDEGDALVVRFRIGICPEFEAWILGLSPEVEVLAPVTLRRRICRRLRDAATLHQPQ